MVLPDYPRYRDLTTRTRTGRRAAGIHVVLLDPEGFRLLEIGGEALQTLLARRVERRYFTVPWPVASYDALTVQQESPPHAG